MGRGTLRLGMPTNGAAWHLRCANRTLRWSTRWEEIPKVRVLLKAKAPAVCRGQARTD
ncbi:MAG: DUF4113 domain-containing protein [Halomonas sp.]|nr:DUF4113 domain-containing protein [Halomonas sp.]